MVLIIIITHLIIIVSLLETAAYLKFHFRVLESNIKAIIIVIAIMIMEVIITMVILDLKGLEDIELIKVIIRVCAIVLPIIIYHLVNFMSFVLKLLIQKEVDFIIIIMAKRKIIILVNSAVSQYLFTHRPLKMSILINQLIMIVIFIFIFQFYKLLIRSFHH